MESEFKILSPPLVWSTHLAFPGYVAYACTNKWHKKENKKVTLHMLTQGALRRCGLTSLVICINDEIHDIREGNVTTRSNI